MSSGRHVDGGAAGAGLLDGREGLLRGLVGLAQGLVLGVVLVDEGCAAVVAEQARGDGDGAARVGDMDDRLAVVRGDFNGGVRAAGGGTADEQGHREALTIHLAGDMHHFVQ